jgi:ABC-type branched-subunit amino acid transport system ATPase component
VANRAIVLDRGRVVCDTAAAALQDDEDQLNRLLAVS